MSAFLVLLFLGLPLLELLVVMLVGAAIGGWATVGLLVLLSVLGVWFLRVEGRRAWSQFRTTLDEGRWPGDEVAQGALVLLGGLLLVVPGFVTATLGLLLLFVPTRRLVVSYVRGRYERGGRVGPFGVARGPGSAGSPQGDQRSGGGMGVEVVEISREQLPIEGGEDRASGSQADE